MSRKKFQTNKLLKGEIGPFQHSLLQYGEIWEHDPETANLIRDIRCIGMGRELYKTEADKKEFDRGKRETEQKLLELFVSAFKTRNASRVVSLAKATDVLSKGELSPVASWVWFVLLQHSPPLAYADPSKRTAYLTPKELEDLYFLRFKRRINPRQLLAIATETLGWKLKAAKRGPK